MGVRTGGLIFLVSALAMGQERVGPIELTGIVTLEDGSAPPEPVRIELVCGSGLSVRPEGNTDAKGHFAISIGRENDILPDATESQGRGEGPGANRLRGVSVRELLTCDVRAALDGFRSDTVSLTNRRALDNPDIGTIILHRVAHADGLTVSATSAAAPKDARKAYEKGMDEAKKNKASDAKRNFEKAVAIYPAYAVAWLELGRIEEDGGAAEEAAKAYGQAIAADRNYATPYQRLYVMRVKQQRWKEAAEASDRALHLDPYDFPDAYYFNAVANFELGDLDTAEKSGREAVKVDGGRNPRTNYVLGFILAKKGRFGEAADCLRAYLQAAPEAKDAATVRAQIDELEKSAGRSKK